MTEKRRLKLRIKLCSFAAMGPGKADLLEAVGRTGSITAAAKDQGMSYRRAWMMIDEINRAFADPVIEASFGGARGGGAKVTPTGLRVIELYRSMQQKAEAAAAAELDELETMVSADPAAPPGGGAETKC